MRLGRFDTLVVFRRAELVALGIEVVPSVRAPQVARTGAGFGYWSPRSCRANMRPWATRSTMEATEP
jgi:hypothetical protein